MNKTVMPSLKAMAKHIIRGSFVLTVMPLLYILDPFIKLRFCLIPNQRIGHMAANTDSFLRKLRQNGTPPRTKYIFLLWGPANQQLAEMFKRELTVLQSKWLVQLHYVVQHVIEKSRFMIIIKGDSHPYTYAANTAPPVLSFTGEEKRKGAQALNTMGVSAEDWYVCFHGRDLSYLNSWRPQFKHLFARTAYRNSADHDYIEAAEFITGAGGYSMRMGAVADSNFSIESNPRIIDIAQNHRTDFMDIFLPATCRFFIGSNSGYAFVPTLFNTPQGMVNMVPPCRIPAGPHDMFIPKLLFDNAANRYLTFPEMEQLGFFRIALNHEIPSICAAEGLTLTDNSPAEITDLCRDLMDQHEGRSPSPMAISLQREFYSRYLSKIDGFEVVGARIGARFAEANPHLIAP